MLILQTHSCLDQHLVSTSLLSYCFIRITGMIFKIFNCLLGEPSGSVVECLTRDRGAAGSSLTGVTALWSLSKTHLSRHSTGPTQEDPPLFN